MALPAATEGGAAEAAAEAAAEPSTEPQASRDEASPQPGAQHGCIDRRVSSAPPPSRATRLSEHIVEIVAAVKPSRLQLHLVLASRIDLLLRKGQEART